MKGYFFALDFSGLTEIMKWKNEWEEMFTFWNEAFWLYWDMDAVLESLSFYIIFEFLEFIEIFIHF